VAWDVIYYRTGDDRVLALDFLGSCPTKVRATLLAVLDAVVAAPPPRFSGGGLWEAMHGEMHGYFEARTQGAPNRTQYRLFCLLENGREAELRRRGLPGPAIAVITGMSKPWMTTFSAADYAPVRMYGADHLARYPRRVAE
jgi:hypothetical protein